MRRMIRFLLGLSIVILVVAVAAWLSNRRTYTVAYGVSFNADHARWLELDPRRTYEDILKELKPKYVRIPVQWNTVEDKKDTFDFSDIDWQMQKAREYGTKVLLVVGQKTPRWPECHTPAWVAENKEDYEARLFRYLDAVVKRYQNHVALDMWQVENEPFIRFPFGDCPLFRSDLVVKEIARVRELDPEHKILMTDSGELGTWRKAIASGDIFGTTVYRSVTRPTGVEVYYWWLPGSVYRWKARLFGLPLLKFFVSELQAEPWFASGSVLDTPVEEQQKWFGPEKLERNLDYVGHIGAPRAYLWGVEWWYWMKEKQGDTRYWETARSFMKP